MVTGSTLTEAAVERAASADRTFGRGEDYVRYVRGLRVVGSSAFATIQAKNVYVVELDWPDGSLVGWCTCPHAARGAFCKHQVAVGLCVVDQSPAPATPGAEALGGSDDTLLAGLDESVLRSLLLELMERDPAARLLVELRVSARQGPEEASALFVELVGDALSSRGFVDYRRSFEVAGDAQDLLDRLESELDAGHADVVRPALLRSLKRLQKLTWSADDSGGVIGDAAQRAAGLYARSCREGAPDAVKLSRWLVAFRDASPGWPRLELADFADAFDDKAWKSYRRAVAKLAETRAADAEDRDELDRMRLELADHDGDVDAAVEVLSAGRYTSYGAIVARLRAAQRLEDEVTWTDRAVAAGSVSRHGQGNDFWLSPDDAASTYLGAARVDDAVAVLRGAFTSEPGAARFQALVRFAAPLGREAQERAWALAEAHRLAGERFGSGAALIEIALREQDLDAAWAAAEQHGPGHLWQPLSDASAATRPRQAAELYRPGLDEDLRFADSKKYAGIADRLVRMRDLYTAAGDDHDFADLMAEVRSAYGRRPSLMAALDRRHLP